MEKEPQTESFEFVLANLRSSQLGKCLESQVLLLPKGCYSALGVCSPGGNEQTVSEDQFDGEAGSVGVKEQTWPCTHRSTVETNRLWALQWLISIKGQSIQISNLSRLKCQLLDCRFKSLPTDSSLHVYSNRWCGKLGSPSFQGLALRGEGVVILFMWPFSTLPIAKASQKKCSSNMGIPFQY